MTLRPNTTRECRHERVHHVHGTREAYVMDRCRCEPCRKANSAAARARRRAIAYGRWNPLVPADPVREHLHRLSAASIGARHAASLAGVPYQTVNRLMWGNPGRGTAPPTRLRRDTAERILALDVLSNPPAGGSRIDARGTRRRLQALVAVGWTKSALARELGWPVSNLRRVQESRHVTAATADAVRILYERLWNVPPDDGTPQRRTAADKARALARENGWLAPLAWDDIDADPEPPHTPAASATRRHDVDDFDIEIAIERVTAGESIRLGTAERDEVIRRLTQRGHSLEQIAGYLDVCPRTVSRKRRASRVA